MPRSRRVQLIQNIEKERKSKVITYLTSTRPNLEAPMAIDAVRRIYDHLEDGPEPDNIDLFLHSNGGDGIVPWRLVTLIRERAKKKFSVLVPYRAFSAATLTALGADEIVMHPMGMLGPTDATVKNLFNPIDPTNPTQRLGISVEDVTAYIALIKEDAGIQHEDELVQAFNHLADKVHPLALGNVKRSLSQSRMMAKKLLSLHMDSSKFAHEIKEIVDNLTSKLYYHGHPINRKEAKDHVGLSTVSYPSAKVEKLIWQLYLDYEKEMMLESAFDMPQEFISDHPTQTAGSVEVSNPKPAPLVFIESAGRSDFYELEYQLSGEKAPNGITSVTLIITRRGWKTA